MPEVADWVLSWTCLEPDAQQVDIQDRHVDFTLRDDTEPVATRGSNGTHEAA